MRRLAISALLIAASAAAGPPARDWSGVWRNAANSVHIRAAPCGKARASGVCGMWKRVRR